MKYILTHWKTSTAALLILFLTYLLAAGHITVTEWIEGFGAVATVIGLLAKDWDKIEEPKDEQPH
jgi:hypothetical protein